MKKFTVEQRATLILDFIVLEHVCYWKLTEDTSEKRIFISFFSLSIVFFCDKQATRITLHEKN